MFEIFNESNKEIKEIDKLQEYMKFVVEKLEIPTAIFNIIFVDNERIHEINKSLDSRLSKSSKVVLLDEKNYLINKTEQLVTEVYNLV